VGGIQALRIDYIENLEEWRLGFNFYIPIKVRFSETDMYGHVNNVSPFIYFEEARIDYIQHLGILTDMSKKDEAIIVADVQCDYWKQIYFNDKLKLYVKVASIGNTSFDLHYMALREDEEIVLTGRGRIVYINPQTGKPKPLTEQMKRKMQ
jgi:acyl-CoA thioester hydrolase